MWRGDIGVASSAARLDHDQMLALHLPGICLEGSSQIPVSIYYLALFLFKIFIYLFERPSYFERETARKGDTETVRDSKVKRGKEMEKENLLVYWFTPQMTTMTRTVHGQRQEPGTFHLDLPRGWQGPTHWVHFLLPPQVY